MVWAGMSNHTEGDFDEKGLYILFWATEHIQGQRMFGLHYMIEMFGLQAWPESISLVTEQGEILSLNISQLKEE